MNIWRSNDNSGGLFTAVLQLLVALSGLWLADDLNEYIELLDSCYDTMFQFH